jgi:hypothetical protein
MAGAERRGGGRCIFGLKECILGLALQAGVTFGS